MSHVSNLVIEVTRKCNMKCKHCMRGSAQSTNIDKKYITTLLKQVDEIYTVTFTGGEPSLNVEAIEFFISEAKRLNIYVGSFYIATNGKRVKADFILACLKLYAMCDEKEMCAIEVSNDLYHNEEGGYNDELLKGLSFYRKRNENDYAEYNLINEGRAKYNRMGKRELVDEINLDIQDVDEFNDATIYLNVNGDIVNGCDWSYTNQNKNIICKVNELRNFINNLAE